MRGALIVAGLLGLMAGCGEAGPSEAELAQKKVEKDCGKLYAGQTKVYKDQLHKSGVSGVEFAPKEEFVAKCVELGLTPEQMKCMDPNLGGTDACKKSLEEVKDKTKELTTVLLAPMKKKGEEKEGEGEEKGEDKAE